ncbi:MAG: cupin domain-containing protein [Anaerolineaceae bacterium]|nr:cupin domain-containing protein [Anaerolineaceae bacterium]
MPAMLQAETPRESFAPGRERYLTHTNNLMMVVIDFTDGPSTQPDPPHSHPHEQITYVVEGEVLFFLGDTPHRLQAGDMITVPSNLPHTIQLLSPKVRLVDTFNPIRQDFLKA